MALAVKNLSANTEDIRDLGLFPGLGRSPGRRDSNQLQYSCLDNPVHRGVWQAAIHRVAKRDRTEVIEHTYTNIYISDRHRNDRKLIEIENSPVMLLSTISQLSFFSVS